MKGLVNKFSIIFFIIIVLYVLFPNIFSNNANTIVRRMIEIIFIITYTKFNIYYGLAMCLLIIFINFRHSYIETFGIDNDFIKDEIARQLKDKVGPTGPRGPTGETGREGKQGPEGRQGARGEPGLDLTDQPR
jgi:hypothetical protein|uniref:Collagen triple helix containing protein n=1 Tax=viral metagenome TaxID=1070528 RepID=A0A6C0LR99_9ZZZZ